MPEVMLDWQERLAALLRQEGLHPEAAGLFFCPGGMANTEFISAKRRAAASHPWSSKMARGGRDCQAVASSIRHTKLLHA